MKTCKDCIHYDVCHAVMTMGEIQECAESVCKNFKDKSLVLDLPCKVGDTVCCIFRKRETLEWYVEEKTVYEIHLYDKGFMIFVSPIISYVKMEIGVWLFFTREAAEQALKEREQG